VVILGRTTPITLPAVLLSASACGGASLPPPKTASETKDTPAASAEKTADKPASDATAAKDAPLADKYAAAEAQKYEDTNEKEGPIQLTGLVAKGTPKSAFPRPSVGDRDCLNELALVGDHRKDYDVLVGKCGTPTGMMKFTEPADGKLHHKLDKRDHFQLKVYKGMCYRYFAVADDGIKDIDILIMKKGALLAMDKTEHPVAIIDTEKLWCVDDDMDLDFAVEVDGAGAGGYTFGVWTRPK
jgi:hypothetical protein